MESRGIHVSSTIMATNVILEPLWVKRRNLDSQPTAVPHRCQQNKAKTPVQPHSFQSVFFPVFPPTLDRLRPQCGRTRCMRQCRQKQGANRELVVVVVGAFYLPFDEAGGGVRRRAAIGAFEAALAFGQLPGQL